LGELVSTAKVSLFSQVIAEAAGPNLSKSIDRGVDMDRIALFHFMSLLLTHDRADGVATALGLLRRPTARKNYRMAPV
jgi:hypothetical protein